MTSELEVRLLRGMLRIRVIEETLAAAYEEQEMRTPTHFSIGQEAPAVGVCTALEPDDVIYSGHRSGSCMARRSAVRRGWADPSI